MYNAAGGGDPTLIISRIVIMHIQKNIVVFNYNRFVFKVKSKVLDFFTLHILIMLVICQA